MTRFREQLTLVGLLSIAAVGAAMSCGGVTAATPDGAAGSGSDAAVEQAPVTTAEGCDMSAKAFCDALDACAPVALKVLYGDKTVCISRAALSCNRDQAVPGNKRTADDLVDCAHAVGTTTCSDLLAGKSPDVCGVKPGEVIDGAACGSDWQCKSTFCNKVDACGVCGPRQAAAGDCTRDGGCAKGLVCANKKCVAPAGPGADCNLPNQPCRTDLYCTSASGSGKCAAKLGAGGACADSSDACDFVKGTICNPVSHVCEAISVAKGGEACGLASKTICVGFVAPCSNFLASGICSNPAADGATCGGNAVCIPPAECVGNVCRLPSTPDCH